MTAPQPVPRPQSAYPGTPSSGGGLSSVSSAKDAPMTPTRPPITASSTIEAVAQPMQQRGLAHSFRSSPAILSLVDTVFQGDAAQGLGDPPRHIAFRDGLPGRTQGFCRRCGTQFSFVPKLVAGDLVGGQYEVLGCLAHGGLGGLFGFARFPPHHVEEFLGALETQI